MIKLRDYQERQFEYIKGKIDGKLPLAIESPTGSGKTIVILEYVRQYFEKHKDEDFTIVLSTGFNKLVHQFAREAKKFGLDPIIWLGKGCVTCGFKIMRRDNLLEFPDMVEYEAFQEDRSLWPTNTSCFKTCPYFHNCFYNKAKRQMKKVGPKFIITNHSSYLIGLNNEFFNTPDIAFIDESHTFASFYESYLKIEITKKEIIEIQKVLSKDKDPVLMLFQRCINKGMKLTTPLFNQVKKKLENKLDDKYITMDLIARLERFSGEKPAIDKYIEVSSEGIEIIKFWSFFDINQANIKYVLFSATQDDFTLEMFGVLRSRLYIERGCNTINYKDSEFLVIPEEKFSDGLDRFLDIMIKEGKNKGLILSTTMVDINYMVEKKEIKGYKVIRSVEEFQEYESKAILVGSRALFQGIDIHGLEFVCLNKIPFPTYNDKFKAQANYLEKVARMNGWTKFTIPQVKNDITQTTGRLWRRPGDKGTIAIMDERLTKRFSYMVKYVEESRKGIKVTILD